jgi:predicted AAA+ superfamily ATPase
MNMASLIPRQIETRLLEALQDTPVVLLAGPRQAGKTTLVKQIAERQGLRYLTMDDELALLSAKEDPTGFIRSIDCVVIDEIQRAPQLLLAIKKSVDEDRRPGRFLLTGSANLMALPTVADSLAGRMETLHLLPLSQSEMALQSANWIDSAFAGRILQLSEASEGRDLVQRVLRGGYPEAVSRPSARRRAAWAKQYMNAIIQRDVRDIASIEKLSALPHFLRALAQTAGQMCNYSQLGAQVGLDGKTASKYIGVFEQLYLLKRVDVWARNGLSRVVKSPKLQFIDSGLLSTVLGMSLEQIQVSRTRFGHVLETFVLGELLKHSSTSNQGYRLLYYRDANQLEVDVVIENVQGELIAVEVKASATVRHGDFKGLRKFAQLAGPALKMGVLLYDGEITMPMGEGIWAAPISSLWGKSI